MTRDIRRHLCAWWLGSVVLLAGWTFWLSRAPLFAALTAFALLLAVTVLVTEIRLPTEGIIRVGYWFVAPHRTASLHFLPPRDLAAAFQEINVFSIIRRLTRSRTFSGPAPTTTLTPSMWTATCCAPAPRGAWASFGSGRPPPPPTS